LSAASLAAGLAGIERAFAERLATVAGAPGLGTAAAVPFSAQQFRRLRAAYSLSPDITYFNHASIGTMPLIVIEAREQYQRACESNPWLYVWSDGFGDARESVRARAAAYLGCDVEELALTHNTTEGMNVLAQGLPLGPGDEVLFSSMNHGGASVCWQQQAPRRGFTVRRFELSAADAEVRTREDLIAAYEREITAATRVLVFPHVDNIVGFRHPVRAIADMARGRGVEFIAIDGAQSVGMLDFRVDELGVDFYCASPHKWVQSPKETGFFYIRRELQPLVPPMWSRTGGGRQRDTVRKYEDYGTRNLSAVMALGAAIDFQARLGPAAKEARCRELWQYFYDRVAASQRLRWRSPRSWELGSSLFAVEIDGVAADQAFDRLLGEHGFVFRAFAGGGLNHARISPNVMNTEEQIDRFIAAAEGL
jgi:selenocysteine lyase/cysteine desulfurase